MKNFILLLLFISLFLSCANHQNLSPEQKLQAQGFSRVDSIQLYAGDLFRIEKYKSNYVSARNVEVWLPESYDGIKKHQVLYMHDGQMLYDSTKTWNKQEWQVDEQLSQMIAQHKLPPTIVVSTWSVAEDRRSDYFPEKAFEMLDDKSRKAFLNYAKKRSKHFFKPQPKSDAYLKFLVEEVKPKIDAALAVYTDAEHTIIGGSSMGGLISFYAVTEYPEVFGNAFGMSTHWPGGLRYTENPFPAQFFSYLDLKLDHLKNHKFYFDFGTEKADRVYGTYKTEVDQLFKDHGFDSSNYKNLKFEGADHSELSWQKRLAIPLTFTLN